MRRATRRLVLREAAAGDALALAAYQSDARYLEHYPEQPDADEIIAAAVRWAAESPRVNHQFVVTLDGAVVGCAGLREAGYPTGEAEIGIELAPSHWGNGYAREVVAALIELARERGVTRILGLTAEANERAHRLVEGLGFRRLDDGRFELTL